MTVRKFAPCDEREVRRLSRKLFGSADELDYWEEQLFVHDIGDGRLGGFISVSVRPWMKGSASSPVAHIAGWYVDHSLRRKGVGRKLLRAAEHWARLNGYAPTNTELDHESVAMSTMRIQPRE